ncbi:hypothetical protein ACLQ3H_24070 [Micromonospora saelicesensis]|uniref:hypothetical protein n=1 Tax=Micromonospora saelicesensis TaxID=285676 RepID=UPI003CF45404
MSDIIGMITGNVRELLETCTAALTLAAALAAVRHRGGRGRSRRPASGRSRKK